MSAFNTIRRIGLVGLATLAMIGGSLAMTAGPAAAFVGYGTPTIFGASGSGNGQFAEPHGVAVDEATGDVYVVDSANGRIEKFDGAGNYLSQFGGSETPAGSFSNPSSIAVDNSAGPAKGDVYVTDVGNSVIDVFDSTGKYLSQITGTPAETFAELLGIAVDASGNAWVYESNGNVDEFSDTSSFVTQFNTGRGTEPGLAVDSQENVYVALGSGSVGKFESTTGTELEEFSSGVSALAVNPSNNNLFVDTRNRIEEYGPFGEPFSEPLAQIGEGSLEESFGIAVNGMTGTVYASQREANTVEVYKSLVFPNVRTGSASNVQKASAVVAGTVEPEGVEAACQIEYGTTISYGAEVACSPADVGSGTSAVPITAEIIGLQANTTYHYRVSATNTNGTTHGTDETFTTLPTEPAVSILPASFLTPGAAVLYATIDTQGAGTEYHFVYGTSSSYGMRAPAGDIKLAPSSTGPQAVSQSVEGLQPDTTYHFAVIATNAGGTSQSTDMTFTTSAIVLPVVLTGTTSDISTNAAEISGTVDSRSVQSSYEFDIGTDTAYGTRAFGDAGSGSGTQTFTLSLQGLAPNTTYHYRLLATNVFGTTYGTDQTFTTPGIPSSLLLAPVTSMLVPTPSFTPPTTTISATPKTAGHTVRRKKKTKKKIKKRTTGKKSGRSAAAGRRHDIRGGK